MNDEIKGAINERLKSAIFGTFTLYLLTINWRVFVFLFSELHYDSKITKIDEYIQLEGLRNAGLAFVFMLATIFVVPISKFFYDRFLLWLSFFNTKYSDDLARQRVVLANNGAKKIQEIIAAKNDSGKIQSSAHSSFVEIENFIQENTAVRIRSPQRLNAVKEHLTSIKKMAAGIQHFIEEFDTEVTRIK